MTVAVADVQSYVGAEDASYVALLTDCLAEAVVLLAGYVRHLRITDDAGATFGVTATAVDGTYTWTDNRDQAGMWLEELVPTEILDRATVEVAADLFARRNAPNGVVNAQFASGDGPGSTPVRINRDPLVPAYPLLSRWTVPF